MVYCVYSLESPHRGDFNENTKYTFILQKIKEILIKLPDLALLSTLIGSNYPCLELIFMVPEVFEPLKLDCMFEGAKEQKKSLCSEKKKKTTIL